MAAGTGLGSAAAAGVATVVAPQPRHAPPGAVLSIAIDGDARAAAAGTADLATGEPATVAHAQDLASIGKVLTTLAVHVLASRGALALTDPLSRFLGERAGAHADATVDELLRHRAGVREWWPLYLDPAARADPLAAALRMAPRGAAGVRRYSDLGMMAVGEAVARVAGMPFADAVRRLVLEPLDARTISPSAPVADAPALTGPDGDAIEREMVRSGDPYPVELDDRGFAWRTGPVRASIADGNAHHAFGAPAGHAGWFGDARGLDRVAAAIARPELLGIAPAIAAGLREARDPEQGQGVRHYRVRWRGAERLLLGHPGFTGAFVGAAAATRTEPELRVALLANRLHGDPAPSRTALADVETLWRGALAEADRILHPTPGGRP
ncbi:serine hydrolase [Agrococcus sp. SL85]|uniref:serine hydrolase domain-containing protein n=1 Tax=Agrococcus sp. SL85 TaxID=2995141 RepID=UPI00226CCE30|nr:serine hydrolase domain-containing protein [Agrococcus sp. SL85]WAC67484.1 serine hydrolase [Agrococcus sp. SL85]